MARGMNHVFLIGALARDPELRYTQSGLAVFEATVAGEDHIVGNDGKERRLPYYHRISMLGKPAEWQGERGYRAGDPVLVEGSLEYNAWDSPEGGKRSIVRVKALRIEQLAAQAPLTEDAGGGVRMAGGMNEVLVVGNLTREPELRYTPGGDAVLSLGLAVNENWTDRSGEKQEKVHWIDVTLWRELAEAMQNLKKGDPVLVKGRLMNESWTDKDGNKRSSTKVEATRVEALSRGAGTGSTAATPAAPRQATGSAAYSAPFTGGAGMGNRSGGLDIDQGLNDIPPEEDDMPF
ncbi:single-strand binding protein [Deinococcus proteolyticus MRP]|uniref:Single-stranded DNA-binding protein n=2 Tax=Deinococcus proteolyticus TaxID=55148 RepID=F0RJS5_DEIPM|nr:MULTISPECIES: single-stranded DNA-binding protein [Deinococcus]ABI95364.1 single-stranded DNA binding protein [Deinococcus proteolyticus MRP]ADY25551.1 single-strand binding protein [Deinococcus proteolyticus MRP]MCY1701671.1 single-stranded DNA-binding protein [Deinococcus sp. SL84]